MLCWKALCLNMLIAPLRPYTTCATAGCFRAAFDLDISRRIQVIPHAENLHESASGLAIVPNSDAHPGHCPSGRSNSSSGRQADAARTGPASGSWSQREALSTSHARTYSITVESRRWHGRNMRSNMQLPCGAGFAMPWDGSSVLSQICRVSAAVR